MLPATIEKLIGEWPQLLISKYRMWTIGSYLLPKKMNFRFAISLAISPNSLNNMPKFRN